jgi:hypothetical protein
MFAPMQKPRVARLNARLSKGLASLANIKKL